MKKFQITEVEMKRYSILKRVIDGFITLKDAAKLLGLSYRQTLRIKKRFIQNGIEGLLRKFPPKPPNLKVNQQMIDEILNLRSQIYYDFNISHFREKLKEIHGISLSYETLRQILIKSGLHKPRIKRRIYRRRRRMPKAGLLVQMDSSQHRWLEHISKPWWLVAMIDDADGYVYAEFHPQESTKSNMEVIKEYIKKRGFFMALYTDRASHFKTTRHGGLHYNVSFEHGDTQIQRALKELNIELIHANSPQAKGRIERLFRFFQDRLIKEMRLRGIKDYDSANKFLKEEFLPWYNRNYTWEVDNMYKEVSKGLDLDLIFSLKHLRKVKKDNTISYRGEIYQLLPMNGVRSFDRRLVEVCEGLDGSIRIFYEGRMVKFVRLTREEYRIQKEEILSMRENLPEKDKSKRKYRPSPNHPWRRGWKLKKLETKNVTFQTGNKM